MKTGRDHDIKPTPGGWNMNMNSDIINLRRSDFFKRGVYTPANQLIEITLSNAKAPAHYIVPFHKKFTEFSSGVTKQRFDCAQCTAAAVDDASKGEISDPTASPTTSCPIATAAEAH